MSVVAHMLWVRGQLGQLENICAQSFVRMGYVLNVWTYDASLKVPAGVTIRDGREVLSEDTLFLNQAGTYAGFSDLFRYAVLRRFGGLYADMDVIALRPASLLPREPFLVTERTPKGGVQINGNVMHAPQPATEGLIDLAFAYAKAFPKHQLSWSEIGPALLSAIVNIYPAHGFAIMPPDFANPIDWWNCPARLLVDGPRPAGCFMHLYNDMWRRAGVDKNAPISTRTLIGRAAALPATQWV
ncbi:MAG: glycosyltransferase [Rhodocyclaceae bacterium]